MKEDAARWTIHGLGKRIGSKEISPVEVTEILLGRIEAHAPTLQSFITIDAEGALEQARQAEREIVAGSYRGPLHGIPLAYKDIIAVRDLRMTSGSKVFENHVASEDATAVSRLRQVGAICMGKLNTSEFAFGSTGHNLHYGDARNPWNLKRVTGGSSSGSANSVSAGLVLGALGSDTGGSVRIPSAACGIVGMKATYGRVSARESCPSLGPSIISAP